MNSRMPKAQAGRVPDHREATLRHYPYIETVARRLTRRMPTYIALEDVISVGVVGLMESIDRYDPRRSDSFNSYAEYRIKGAILDAIRASDQLSRDQRVCADEIRRVWERLFQLHGREPEPEEMAEELGCELERYYELLARIAETRPARLHEGLTSSDLLQDIGSSALSDPRAAERRTLVMEAIEGLPGRHRELIVLHYFHDIVLKKIGEGWGVTESRACQIHGEALSLLRQRLADEPPAP